MGRAVGCWGEIKFASHFLIVAMTVALSHIRTRLTYLVWGCLNVSFFTVNLDEIQEERKKTIDAFLWKVNLLKI